jgi:hypothetical protein
MSENDEQIIRVSKLIDKYISNVYGNLTIVKSQVPGSETLFFEDKNGKDIFRYERGGWLSIENDLLTTIRHLFELNIMNEDDYIKLYFEKKYDLPVSRIYAM